MKLLDENLRLLGLNATASEKELKSAYRKLIVIWHPDKHQSDPSMHESANEKAKALNYAFEYLSELYEQKFLPRVLGSVSPHQSTPPIDTNARQQTDYTVRHQYNGQPFKPGFPDPDVFEVFVKSSFIVSVGYSYKGHMLYIKMGVSVYRYLDVPEHIFEGFLSATSHGKYFNHHIVGSYRCEYV